MLGVPEPSGLPPLAVKRIVLCRPSGPRNVGSVLRASLNFGPAELVVVAPAKPSLLVHPDFEQMAHGVPDMSERLRVVATLPEALQDATAVYGFTARTRDHRELVDWRDARDEMHRRSEADEEVVALVFGSEQNGLTGEETDACHELVRMPTSDEHTSLNLAMAVGIVLSTLFFADAPSAQADASTPLPNGDRAFLIERLKDVLGDQTRTAPARRDLVSSIERVFSRAPLETRDARAWHLLVRSLGGDARPQDYGLAPQAPPPYAECKPEEGATS